MDEAVLTVTNGSNTWVYNPVYLDTNAVSNNNKKDEDMYAPSNKTPHAVAAVNVAPAPTQEQETRDYFRSELRKVKYNFDMRKLKMKFGLKKDKPTNGKELIQFIKDGMFTLKDDAWFKERDGWFLSITDGIEFGDPKIVADNDGYRAAYAAFDKAYTDAKRKIMATTDGEAQLAAVTEFEAYAKSLTD